MRVTCSTLSIFIILAAAVDAGGHSGRSSNSDCSDSPMQKKTGDAMKFNSYSSSDGRRSPGQWSSGSGSGKSHPQSSGGMGGNGKRRNRMSGVHQSWPMSNGVHMSDRGSMSPQAYGGTKGIETRRGKERRRNKQPINQMDGPAYARTNGGPRGGIEGGSSGPVHQNGGGANRAGPRMQMNRGTNYGDSPTGHAAAGVSNGYSGGRSKVSSGMGSGGYGSSAYGGGNGPSGHSGQRMDGGWQDGRVRGRGGGGAAAGGGSAGRWGGGARNTYTSNGRSRQQSRNDGPSNGSGNNDQAYKLAALGEEIAGPITKSFSCKGKAYGYYPDVANGCKVYHVCAPEQKRHFSFFCNAGTIFDRESETCVRKNQITCK